MRTFDVRDLVFIISYFEQRCNDDVMSIAKRKSVTDDLRDFSARFDAQQPPAEGFHLDLWRVVRAKINRLLSDYAK